MASHFLTKITRRIAARPSSSDGSPTPPPMAGDGGHGHAAAGGEDVEEESQYKDIDAAVKIGRSPPRIKSQTSRQGTPHSTPPAKTSPDHDLDDDEVGMKPVCLGARVIVYMGNLTPVTTLVHDYRVIVL